jgi:hypothetical protein
MAPASTPAPAPQPRPQPVGIVQFQNGLIQRPAPSPATTDETRRSPGGFSLPPQSAAELAWTANKNKQSVHLTKQQQDAWNAHRLNQASRSSMAGGAGNANMLFGGVDSLIGSIEDSQDWWLKDQSSIAHGFENWVDPNIDWSSIEADMNAGTNGFQTATYGPVSGTGLQSGFPAFSSNVLPLKQSLSAGTSDVNGQFGQNGYDNEMYF